MHATTSDELRLLLFGAPQVRSAEGALHVGRRKALALLAYLALAPTRHHREVLATLLWPEAPAQHAFACLRNALWTLRQTPLEGVLHVERTTVELDNSVWVDALRFRELRAAVLRHGDPQTQLCPDCVAALREAVALRRAPFMEGFTVSHAAPFEEWMLSEQTAFDHEAADALARLALHEAAQGDVDEAITHVQGWLSLEPLSEQAHREAIRLHALSGHRERALGQYEICVKLLRDELGLAPAEETTQLVEQLYPADKSAAEPESREIVHELPEWHSSFVGRSEEIALIRKHLLDEGTRLVTLTGLGGTGKTRLALRAAQEIQTAFHDGVAFAGVSATSDGPFVASALADALKLPALRQDPEQLSEAVLGHLTALHALLVIDGLESKPRDLSLLPAILLRCPQVSILATSREPLGLQAEHVLDVPGLPTPHEGSTADPAEYPSVQLFVTAARKADLRFSPTPEDFASIAAIARMVDGLPLAMELAASWVPTLPCGRIASQIRGGLDFLSSVDRDILPRHQNLRAVFDEGWSQLPRTSRLLLRRLSVFSSPFTYEAAHDVAEAELADLVQLSRRSLIHRSGPDRFALHPLLRQFAGERLDTSPQERDAVYRSHAEHFLAYVAQHASGLKGSEQRAVLDDLHARRHEIRAAWKWAAVAGLSQLIRRASFGMFLVYDMMTRFDEGAVLFAHATSTLVGNVEDSGLDAMLLACHGWFVAHTDPPLSAHLFSRARVAAEAATLDPLVAFVHVVIAFAGQWPTLELRHAKLEQALTAFEAAQDPWAVALALEADAAAHSREDRHRAREQMERSLELRRQLDDRWGMALALTQLGSMAVSWGSLPLAERRFSEALRFYRTIADDIYGVVDCLAPLAWISDRLGDFDTADRRAEEALALARRTGNASQVGKCLQTLALIAHARGQHAEAARHAAAAQPLLEHVRRSEAAALCATVIGEAALASGRIDTAQGHFEEGEALDPGNPRSLIGLAEVAAARGDTARRNALATDALRAAAESDEFALLAELLLVAARFAQTSHRSLAIDIAAWILRAPRGDHRTQRAAAALLQDLQAKVEPLAYDAPAGDAAADLLLDRIAEAFGSP